MFNDPITVLNNQISSFSTDQVKAWEQLNTDNNIFLTGAAGSGKSHLIRSFLKTKSPDDWPILASTGSAAILVGGRTFHSFFGLGIFEGGIQKTVERALTNPKVTSRCKKAIGIVIDEISMIPGPALAAAEQIARLSRKNARPWGGLRVIAVGDFCQLPPVHRSNAPREWAFLHDAWSSSHFLPIELSTIHRTNHIDFLERLNELRQGQLSEKVQEFLNERSQIFNPQPQECTQLFGLREQVENFNRHRLDQLHGAAAIIKTTYVGKNESIESFKRSAPIPEELHLKRDALVMIRSNDPQGRWANGSLAIIDDIRANEIDLTLLSSDESITMERQEFQLLNGDGETIATANNFPINLAWAMTIHKAQGTTLDRVQVDLTRIWEHGQTYVALSRVRSPDQLFISGWNRRAIRVDDQVTHFLHLMRSITEHTTQ